mmetsp:Transcript_65928/g.208641  ORF Transcript_65928/g.208641 Transcript_65928/m.208641 type:complete len:363 (-) Transcript_65928:245-1333(-)
MAPPNIFAKSGKARGKDMVALATATDKKKAPKQEYKPIPDILPPSSFRGVGPSRSPVVTIRDDGDDDVSDGGFCGSGVNGGRSMPSSQRRIDAFFPPPRGSESPASTSTVATRGMVNLGNTCYMGATLQALASLDGFVAELLLAARSAPQGSVAAALADCLREHRDGRGGESAQAVNPARLKHNLARHNLRFLGFAQQDAHEFLFALLGRVQEELLAAAAGPLPPPPARPPPALLSRTGDPTARQLSGCILHDHKCNKCGGGPTIREQVTHLSLEVPPAGHATVESLLADYFADEEVERDCEACAAAARGGRGDPCRFGMAAHRVLRLPRVLVLHLKRFRVGAEGEGASKILTPARTPRAPS